MKFCESVRVPRVSNWQNLQFVSKDEAPMPVGFCLFVHLLCPSHNSENSHCLSNATKLWTKDIAGSSTRWQKWGYKSCGNPVPICLSWDTSMVLGVTGHYWVVWGHTVRKKSRWGRGGLGQSGIITMHYQSKKGGITCIYNPNWQLVMAN